MKLARLAVCAGAFVILSATYAAAKSGYALTTVNVRSGPGTTNEIVAKIPGGSRVEVNNCANGWCEVSWQGKTGFSIETALDMSGRAPPRTSYYGGPPPAYVPAPAPYYYGPPAYYYGPPGYYYRPWRRRWYYY